MKHLVKRYTFLAVLIFTACDQKQLKITDAMISKFEAFKQKEKFIPDNTFFYPGVANEAQKPLLTEKINLIANDFETLAITGNATENQYQDAIKKGLERFNDLEPDTEDRERICHYIEELMDIVNLENSNGHLNNFMYGFDPGKSSD